MGSCEIAAKIIHNKKLLIFMSEINYQLKEQELLHTLALQHVSRVGGVLAKRLVHHCGSSEAVFKTSRRALLAIDGVGELIVKELMDPDHLRAASEELKFIKDNAIDHVCYTDTDYPERLKHCIDGPIVLFKSGNINLSNKRVVSIVGTRKITSSGKYFCEKLIADLVPLDPVIVSGFAYGIDITAQKAAMHLGLQTIGCLAHGLNQIYPKVHKKYVSDIEKHGGFYTDFWSSDTFDRNNFLKRNRIIAGISEATIVIESAEKGGSLVTADIAHSYDREVFAVPGRPSDTYSVGCNNLIKQQKAHLLTSAADLVYILGWELAQREKVSIQKRLFVELDDTEKKVYNILKQTDKELLDVIALNCDMPVHKVTATLLSMELKGVVRPLPGKLFELV